MWKIHRTGAGWRIETHGRLFAPPAFTLDDLFSAADPREYLAQSLDGAPEPACAEGQRPLAPVQNQEIWAAGVTYYRSRQARMEESENSGGDRFYDLVYEAPRPELFFKSTAARVRGPGEFVRVRADSTWSVPEPELALAINSRGQVFGYAIGNDMSARDIEGENPLYLPQAKIYRGSCALGPCLTVCDPLAGTTEIRLEILRNTEPAFNGSTFLTQLKRGTQELADWLFRENEFPCGAYLLTGTGIVPPSDFTLKTGDVIRIAIDGLGVLENEVR